jgi:hypothetical protein
MSAPQKRLQRSGGRLRCQSRKARNQSGPPAVNRAAQVVVHVGGKRRKSLNGLIGFHEEDRRAFWGAGFEGAARLEYVAQERRGLSCMSQEVMPNKALHATRNS